MKPTSTRQRRTPEQWQAIIDQWQSSGISAPKFCAAHNITYSNFCQWRNRLKSNTELNHDHHVPATPVSNSNLGFIDITSLQSHDTISPWRIVLKLGDGMELVLSRG